MWLQRQCFQSLCFSLSQQSPSHQHYAYEDQLHHLSPLHLNDLVFIRSIPSLSDTVFHFGKSTQNSSITSHHRENKVMISSDGMTLPCSSNFTPSPSPPGTGCSNNTQLLSFPLSTALCLSYRFSHVTLLPEMPSQFLNTHVLIPVYFVRFSSMFLSSNPFIISLLPLLSPQVGYVAQTSFVFS